MTRSRFVLGPVLLALLLGVALYGAFCVNVKPAVVAAPSPTVVLVRPTTFVFASPSPDIFTVPPTMTPREAILVPLPKPTRTPRPTATPEPTNTPRPERSPVQRG